jgi:hypothetical protein
MTDKATRKLCVFLAITALGLFTKANLLWVLLMCGLVELTCRLESWGVNRTESTSTPDLPRVLLK